MDRSSHAVAIRDSPRARLLLFLASALLVAAPFAAVTFPPIADLPQHAAQLRLFGEAVAGGSPYEVQWATPYTLAYLVLGAARLLVAPWAGAVAAATCGAAAIALLWLAAIHLLAWRCRRPAAAATVAGLLVFHHALYWGFLPFLVGFPVFALWLLALRREPRPGWRENLGFAALAMLLYLAHALWFAAGLGWLVVSTAWQRRRGRTALRELLPRAAGAGVVAVLAAVWYAAVSTTSFATPPLWVPESWRRLLPASWVEAAFGGLSGRLEPLAFTALALWLALAAWAARRRLRELADGRLALLGALFVLAALVLPDKLTNTIEFNDRWMPPGLALLLLAAPPLPVRRGLARGLAVVLLAAFVSVTAPVWQRAEEEELAGLPIALAVLPDQPRVLGLDFVRGSRYLDRQPYLQQFAWAQVLRGGELNFSFAEFPPSPVVFYPPRDAPWTPGLEWFPQAVRREDFGWFDYALVRAPEDIHARLAAEPFLTPVTPPAPWRLYRVEPGAPRERFVPPAPHPR